MLKVKVTKRDGKLTKGIFKVGTVITLDLQDMFELWFRGRFGFAPARKDDGYAEPEVQRMWVRWKEKQREQ